MDDREKLVNYDYGSNSSRNFIEFDQIDFEIYLILKQNDEKKFVPITGTKIIPIKYDFEN